MPPSPGEADRKVKWAWPGVKLRPSLSSRKDIGRSRFMISEEEKCHTGLRSNFEMALADVFAFEDGRTVFAAEIIIGPNYIPPCDCELLIGETPVARFRLGEMLPLNKTEQKLRSVSTTDPVDVPMVRRSQDQCKVRFFGRQAATLMDSRRRQ